MMRRRIVTTAAAVVIAVCVMAAGCGPGSAGDEMAYTEETAAETVTEMAENGEEMSLEDALDDDDASSDDSGDTEETDTGAGEGTTAEAGTAAAETAAAETTTAVADAETTAVRATAAAGTDTEEQTTAAEETTAAAETAALVTVGSVAAEMAVRSGMVGRLVISSAGINVALISAPITDSSVSQAVVDGEDSAAYMVASATIYIADHYYQAFDTLKDVAVGDTALIVTDTGVTELVCTSVQDAYNTGARLVDGSGNAISLGTYTAYTCLDSSGYPVRAVCFEPAS